jgi:hypothetical protein
VPPFPYYRSSKQVFSSDIEIPVKQLNVSLANQTITIPPPSSKHVNVATIVGPIVGVLVVIALSIALAVLSRRRRNTQIERGDKAVPNVVIPFMTLHANPAVSSKTALLGRSSQNAVQPNTTPSVTNEQNAGIPSPETNAAQGSSGPANDSTAHLHSQVEQLRIEMEQLRCHPLLEEAPPLYD